MAIVGFSRGNFQAGDDPALRIQADMGFEPVEVFGLFDFLARFCFDFAFVLDTPAGIPISRLFAFFFLSLFIFGGVHVGHTMNTIDDLDGSKLNPTLTGNFHNLGQHFFKDLQFATLEQPLAKYCQRGMIRSLLIHCQAHKVLRRQVLVNIDLHLPF